MQSIKTGKSALGKTGYIINADGGRIPISVSTAIMRELSEVGTLSTPSRADGSA